MEKHRFICGMEAAFMWAERHGYQKISCVVANTGQTSTHLAVALIAFPPHDWQDTLPFPEELELLLEFPMEPLGEKESWNGDSYTIRRLSKEEYDEWFR